MKDFAIRRLLNRLSLLLGVATLALMGCDAVESDGDDGVDRQDVLATRMFDETIQLSSQDAFSLENINGDVVIEASGTGRRITVEAELIAGSHSRSDAERWLDKLAVRISNRTHVVAVETDFPNDAKGRRLEVRYHVRIPEGIDVELHHVNGQITLADIVGDVGVNHINGRVDIDNLRGSLDVHLINGTIDCHVTLDPGGFAFLSTMNGEIKLDIPKSTSARLHAEATNGEVRFEDLTMHGESGNRRDRAGTIGDGGGQIELSVVNGTITVKGI